MISEDSGDVEYILGVNLFYALYSCSIIDLSAQTTSSSRE